MRSNFLQLSVLLGLIVVLSAGTCSSNQYYASDGHCVDCPANCTTCSTELFCTACLPNFYLVSYNFNSTCQTCNQIFVGCKTCLSNVACSVCSTGYYISGGVCVACASTNLFCADCSTDGKTCNLCYYPYILLNNMCVSKIVVNSPQDSAIPANTSTTGPTNPVNDTVPSNLITLTNGTKVSPVLDDNGCNQIQTFQRGKCILAIANCVLYQLSGQCAYCANNYLVTIFGDCSPKNSVLACESGYWLDKENNRCVSVSPSCDWYYPNNGSCLNCSKGYSMVNSTCVQSVHCNSRQFFFQGACITVPAACTTFSPIDGTCLSCQTGYSLNAGMCTQNQISIVRTNPCTSPCATCHFANPKYCFSCIPYWTLANAQYGSCLPVPRT